MECRWRNSLNVGHVSAVYVLIFYSGITDLGIHNSYDGSEPRVRTSAWIWQILVLEVESI
jgi:hypothetical protein